MAPKVLYVASTHSHLVNFHRPYLRHYRDRGWQVDAACGGPALDIPEAHHVYPIPFAKSITAPENLKALARLRALIRREGYDLLHLHTSLAAFFARAALWGLRDRPRVVNTVHGYLFGEADHGPRARLLLTAERLTAGRTDLLLTMNQEDLRLARRYRLGREIRPIPGMGVDFSALTPADPLARVRLRAGLGLTEDDVLLISPAAFSARKNQLALIRLLPQLPPRVKLLLPGQGAMLEDCRAQARALDAARRVFFPGHVSPMGPWYAAADGAVSVSRSEGLPFNLMEAMACGLPVAATAVKGHVDLVESEVTGLLAPPDDPDALARCLRRLAEDPDLRRRLGQAGREAVQAYALPRVYPQVLAALGEPAEAYAAL